MTTEPAVSQRQLSDDLGHLLELSLNEVYIWEAESLRFLLVNRGGRENLGYSMAELREMTPLDVMPRFTPESLAEVLAPLEPDSDRSIVLTTVLRRKDGSQYNVEAQVQRSSYKGCRVITAMVLDATERQRARQMRRVGEARLQAILDNAVEAIVTVNASGICESFNLAAERMFGYRADEVIGQNVSLLMPPPYRDEHDTYMANYYRTGVKKIIGIGREVVGQKKDGTVFPIYLSVSEVNLAGQRLFTGMIQDLTEQKESQRRLVQSERLAAVGEALTGLAHESRNLLQKIQMAVEFARMEVEDHDAVSGQLDAIERASDGLRALLDEVRNYAAPIRLELSEECLADLWREAWQSLQRERNTRRALLREELCDARLVWPVDRFRMVRVFRNLLENSLAACTDPVEITIHVTETHTPAGPEVEIAVRDNGPGLTAEQERRVFEPFFTTKAKGTGLGMAIAHRIIEAHGGRITVGRGPTSGAEFRIQLPSLS